MEHFSEQAWADFVRGISNPERGQMEAHLAEGCNRCAAAHDAWKRVHTVALRESNYTPPEDTVRMTKAVFASRPFVKDTRAVLASLVFDTLAQPVLAGVRSAAAPARQMVYEAEGLMVDLRLEGPPPLKRIYLTGQVLDKRAPRALLDEASVILWTDNGLPVAETKANALGEFNLELEPQESLRLSIQVVGRALIRIPLAVLQGNPSVDDRDTTSN
jgi:hypothetical protein